MQTKFFLNMNQKKNTDKSPDYWGYIKDESGEKRQKVSAWEGTNKNGRYISVIIDDVVPSAGQSQDHGLTFQQDDLPF